MEKISVKMAPKSSSRLLGLKLQGKEAHLIEEEIGSSKMSAVLLVLIATSKGIKNLNVLSLEILGKQETQ